MQAIADELIRVVDVAAIELKAVSDSEAASKPAPSAWSVKEILGHLIDSAANNHQRFVRAQQISELAFPAYQQNLWVESQDYQSRPWLHLVDFWVLYNHHLAHVIRRIPASAAQVVCRIGSNEPVTLGFLVEDYVVHLRHHLEQIRKGRAA